jgi:alpha-beta hydrolase superfamily lysophospholipase
MTLADQPLACAEWNEPDGVTPRGTVIVVPGRGEQAGLYERFGRRLGSDRYRVRAVADPVTDPDAVRAQVAGYLAEPGRPSPVVLAGSDTGALFAAWLAASEPVDALILAGAPVAPGAAAGSFDDELDARTTCPVHRGKLASAALRPGALYEPVPDGWAQRAALSALTVPVLALHGQDDPVSPLGAARAWYAGAPGAELVSIARGRHDILNDQMHRSVAASAVLFLERLRLDNGLAPIAVAENLAGADD